MADKANGFTFTWKIENFSMLPIRNGDFIQTESFKVDTYRDVVFYLSLFPRGVKEKEGYAACFLNTTESNLDLKVKFYFALQSTETADAIVSKTLVYPANCSKLGIDDFFQLNEIFEKKRLYFPSDTLTIHCHFSLANEACAETTDNKLDLERYFTRKSCVCRSRSKIWRKSDMWSIRNINNLGEIVEKVFYGVMCDSVSFKLSINFSEISINKFIPIEIRKIDNPDIEYGVFVKCKIAVVSANKEYQDFIESTHFFPLKPDVWQFPPFLKASNLTRDKYLFLDDTLHLLCEFAVSYDDDGVYDEEHISNTLTLETIHNYPISELSASIKKCYSSGKFCDIQLHAGGQTFPSHRLVLGARSSVFSAMFENDMKEKNSGVVDINDLDPDTLKTMLAFLYEEVLPEDLSPEDVRKLYYAADKYGIPPLKYRCWVSLISSLSVASVCDVLVIADAHQDSFLLTAVYNFISSHVEETFNSSYWKSLMNDNIKLSAEVMHKMLTEKNLF